MNTTKENSTDRLVRLAFEDLARFGTNAGYTPSEITQIKKNAIEESDKCIQMDLPDFIDHCARLAGCYVSPFSWHFVTSNQ